MQLSIEAIIILVIAIVLLGLGIGFIKNFFGKGTDALAGSFDPIAEHCDVSADNPVVPREIELSQGKSKQVRVCVYNNQVGQIPGATIRLGTCVDPAGLTKTAPTTAGASSALPSDELKFIVLGQDLDKGTTKGYKVGVSTSGTAQLGTYICNAQIQCTGPSTGPKPCLISGPTTTPTIPFQMAITVT
jgi:hypothetical protein